MQPTSEAAALRARTFVCMGTVVGLTVPVSPPSGGAQSAQAEVDRLEAATAVVEDQFAGLDAQFSLFRPTSEASRIARGDLSLMEASPLMRDLYADAVRWRRRTDGAFTPERPDGLLDLSGLVKGYAIAEAGRSLAALGLTDWCLNAGGDVLVSGSPAPSSAASSRHARSGRSGAGQPESGQAESGQAGLPSSRGSQSSESRGGAGVPAWLAGIVDPADRRTLLGAYPLGGDTGTGREGGGPAASGQPRRLALATSGSAERGDHIWTVGIRRGAAGARPEFAQVSVAASDIVTADVLATAIVAGGRATLDSVTSRWDVDVLAVAHDGALLATAGIHAPSAA